MATITEPILLDSTGQDIVEALETIAENMGTSAGHTIQNDSGTDMQRRDKLQFKGVYVEDDQTNDVTKVDICRTMTKAQMEALSGEALKGFINTSDEPDSLPLTAEWVAYDSNTSVKEKIDDVSRAISPTNVSLTLTSGNNLRIQKIDVRRNGEIAIIFLRLQATSSISGNTEIEVGTFSGINYIGHISGACISVRDTSIIGGYATNASNALYVNFNSNISTNGEILITIPCFIVTS